MKEVQRYSQAPTMMIVMAYCVLCVMCLDVCHGSPHIVHSVIRFFKDPFVFLISAGVSLKTAKMPNLLSF